MVTTVIQLHCGYHSYLTELYVGSAVVLAMYACTVGAVSYVYQTYTSACLFDTLVFGLPHYHKATVWESRKVGFLKVFLLKCRP